MIIVFPVLSCGRAPVVRPAPVEPGLFPVKTVAFERPAVAVASDGEELFVLEASGARVLRFSSALVPMDTLPLTDRVIGPRGIGADRFYVYVYTDRTLFRLLRKDPVLVTWLHGVRTVGLAAYSPGEMLVSDADRAAIWFKTLFGESRLFLDAADLARPGALAGLPDGMFVALSGGEQLVRFNRAGIVTDRQILPGPVDLMAADRQGTIYLARTGRPELIVIRPDGPSFSYSLQGGGYEPSPAGLAVCAGGIVVLDRDTRLLFYRLP